MNTGVETIKEIFKKNSKKIFIVDAITEKEYSYGEIENLSLKLASVLSGRGIKKGDTVAVMLPNCIEFVLLYFACMQQGAIVVPINPRLTAHEIQHISTDSNAKLLISSNKLMKDFFANDCSLSPPTFVFRLSGDLETNTEDTQSLFDVVAAEDSCLPESFSLINDEDVFVISYTSGTTALPKGVVVIYKNFIGNGSLFVKTVGIDSGARFYSILPLAYMGGWYNLMMIPLLAGGSVVLDQVFGPSLSLHFWENIIKYRVNSLWFVPSIMSILLSVDRGEKGVEYCKENIKIALVGTAPLSRGLKEEFEKQYSIKLYENYGLSETFFITTNSPKLARNKGVGRVLEGCAVSAVNEKGEEAPAGEAGEIVARTPFHAPGYYKNFEATKDLIREKGICTGDIGYLDDEGYLFITGRKKDIIIKGGINISPAEIEDVISVHPLVSEVAVVGIPDEVAGEEIAAFIKTKQPLSAQELKEFCNRNLAQFKIPKYIKFVEDFPRTATGKIQKNKIKEELVKNFKI